MPETNYFSKLVFSSYFLERRSFYDFYGAWKHFQYILNLNQYILNLNQYILNLNQYILNLKLQCLQNGCQSLDATSILSGRVMNMWGWIA